MTTVAPVATPIATPIATIKQLFADAIDQDQSYTAAEMKKILADIYKANFPTEKKVRAKKVKSDDDNEAAVKVGRPAKQPKLKANGEERKKREPSAYNIYYKEQYPIVKMENPTLAAKEILKMVAAKWNQHKAELAADA